MTCMNIFFKHNLGKFEWYEYNHDLNVKLHNYNWTTRYAIFLRLNIKIFSNTLPQFQIYYFFRSLSIAKLSFHAY